MLLLGIDAGLDTYVASIVTCSFTPGSCSLAAYRVTPAGLKWAKSTEVWLGLLFIFNYVYMFCFFVRSVGMLT